MLSDSGLRAQKVRFRNSSQSLPLVILITLAPLSRPAALPQPLNPDPELDPEPDPQATQTPRQLRPPDKPDHPEGGRTGRAASRAGGGRRQPQRLWLLQGGAWASHVAFRVLPVEWPTTEPLLMFLDLDGD